MKCVIYKYSIKKDKILNFYKPPRFFAINFLITDKNLESLTHNRNSIEIARRIIRTNLLRS